MLSTKEDIISRLKKEILVMQGFKPSCYSTGSEPLHIIRQAFPNSVFPVGVMHEFFCSMPEEISSSSGFIGGILSMLMKNNGVSVWISSAQNIFPPALKLFGLSPENIIFIQLKKEKDKLWAAEEALKCDGFTSVVAEIDEISFIESRRFQLAVEQSKVTGFLIRRTPRNLSTACVTRWRITPVPSEEEADLPGVGSPKWYVELLKVRNGKCGSWLMEWKCDHFKLIHQSHLVVNEPQRKIV